MDLRLVDLKDLDRGDLMMLYREKFGDIPTTVGLPGDAIANLDDQLIEAIKSGNKIDDQKLNGDVPDGALI